MYLVKNQLLGGENNLQMLVKEKIEARQFGERKLFRMERGNF